MQKQTLDRLLAETNAEPQESQAVPKKQLQGLEKQCLAVMGQCMEIMTLGGPQLEDLLRTAQDRSATNNSSKITILSISRSQELTWCSVKPC